MNPPWLSLTVRFKRNGILETMHRDRHGLDGPEPSFPPLPPRTLRAALWPSSTATRNLTRTPRATIALVHEGSGYYLRCCARRGEDLEGLSGEGRLAFFEMEIVEAMEDAVAYAKLTSGVTFQLANPGKVLPRWRETVTALRELPSPG